MAISASLFVAGCTSNEPVHSPASSPNPTATEMPNQTETEDGREPYEPSATYKTVTVGSRMDVASPEGNRPHNIAVWNMVSSSRRIQMEVVSHHENRRTSETVLSAEYAVPGEEEIVIQLREPSNYTVDIQIPADNGSKRFTISRTSFDCNTVRWYALARANGSVTVRGVSTAVACDSG